MRRLQFGEAAGALSGAVLARGLILAGLAAVVLTGCGGAGFNSAAVSSGTSTSGSTSSSSSSGTSSNSNSSSGSYVTGQFLPEAQYANRCASPRSGTDSITGAAYPDTQGTSTDENNFLRSWTHDLYLWYSEVPDLNPAAYASPANDYFPLLMTSATYKGAPKDKFHFTYDTSYWESLSVQGVTPSYGVDFEVLAATVPRNIVIGYTEPLANVPTGVGRGATVLTVDGVDVQTNTQAGVDTLNAGLFPATVGEKHTFKLQGVDGSVSTVTLTAANVTETPVDDVKVLPSSTGNVGYILFKDHFATAEAELVNAINTLKAAGVQDLVLDLRYNGGGYLDIASELAYMIAGPAQTAGKTFELLQFNDQHPTVDPVAGTVITPTDFHSVAQGFSLQAGSALPTLNLSRVYVLATSDTCSASESVINSLRGIGVQVVLIGSTTCGKPYGFYPQDNCGTTYFSIQFRGVNAANYGDYTNGFSPGTPAQDVGQDVVQGCSVDDDFAHALGDASEGMTAAALAYRQQPGSCPAASSSAVRPSVKQQAVGGLAINPRSPLRQMRILRH